MLSNDNRRYRVAEPANQPSATTCKHDHSIAAAVQLELYCAEQRIRKAKKVLR